MIRREFLKNSALSAGLLSFYSAGAFSASINKSKSQMVDYHVHLTDTFTIEDAVKLANERGVKFGIVEHPHTHYGIRNDKELEAYIDKLRKFPVYVGLQPMELGWSKNYSQELLSQVDYILMDPQTFKYYDGTMMGIWQLTTYVEDTEAFMKRYVEHSLEVLRNEPIDIFGWPLFLPVCIARDYYTLWTEERMQSILTSAKDRNIAIEINDMAHVPHDTFIKMAKSEGLKFTFGSDARNDNAGRLSYCKKVADICGLKESDFFKPKKRN